jgi:hypothetical protein
VKFWYQSCDEGKIVTSAILTFFDTVCPLYRVVSWKLYRIGSVRPPGNLESVQLSLVR